MIDDIPEATREPVETKTSSSSPFPLIVGSGLMIFAIAISSIWFFNRPTSSISQQPAPEVNPSENLPPETTETIPEPIPEAIETAETKIENVLGHLPYEEVSASDLVAITSDGSTRLHQTAAEKFRQMEADARAQGIKLAVISGFRSVETQNSLFFDVKEQRIQDTAKRAEVSAPPGYSEHHTGYAIDLGDANVPATHLSPKFEDTAAFKWLEQNAAKYSFELSFPRDNPQGISYEPWHWRFVGDRQSLETFYKARNLQ
ncbi:D-alanyl-D-alanine carboxypeptidase [Hyella patelloides LEGE 07179]|uniref:D-alanyl-D-alanine carboxypeptidase n=1 Tax=Hyella patelloides LEGE 07179 TaxID=945734 RepID=A0A563W0A8_9CYAN|nr:M15 family metallopeptidase [Hyella patelloides]VEP17116.1 D-alanyl-D-alanine carboxypeptidase [Hyella patelloides LEGE 07179]